eukprot:CAMPEP_0183306130 /NCGR_PEP_ID=MMETSP0160_2-20130417/10651_1 /TAXON_ID=2839 ORGANISM="Odontella Sinensis, Strain Grunow 1884" /NCGR_SAMPLE_ID=MMETSP0160_2 /ASSEMBLY_ACC=CAM_ASM_000250 /LENGTH=93 /DNA_ID=CAMNT_0025469449 /DNA_START=44 /DNA_END=322 /DNA_ORIENTATION=-
MSSVPAVFIVAAKRTPFGSFGGSLKSLTSTELAAVASKSALSSAGPNLDPSHVDASFFGNAVPSSPDGPYLARHAALMSGVPVSKPYLARHAA